MAEPSGKGDWTAYQFDFPKSGHGVVEIFLQADSGADSPVVRLRNLDVSGRYEMKGYSGTLAPADERFFEGTFFGNCDKELFTRYLATLDDLPILSDVVQLPLSYLGLPSSVEGKTVMSGRELCEQGLTIKPANTSRVVWIVYQRAK